MLSDPRYVNNVILQKDGFQELLTNIKNYPIIDIENVTEDETDERITTSNVWQDYTDGSPCIKVVYGDNDSIKGNIIFAEIFKKLQAKAKRKIIELENESLGYNNELAKWTEVYNKNKEIYDKRKDNLVSYLNTESDSAAKKAKNIINAIDSLTDDYNTTFDMFWDNQTYPDYPYIRVPEGTNYDQNITYYLKAGNGTFSVFTYTNDSNWNTNLANEKIYVNQPVYPAYEKRSIPVLGLSEYTVDFPIIQSLIRSAALSWLQSQYDSTENSTIKAAYGTIKNELETYPSYQILENGEFSYLETNNVQSTYTTPANILEYVENYLNKVINSAKVKMDNAQTIKNYYNTQNSAVTVKINRLKFLVGRCDDLILLIAKGEKKVKSDTVTLISNIKNNPDTFIENYINNSNYSTVLTESNALDNVTNGIDRRIYGYKYIKVGSNIQFKNPNNNNSLSPISAANAATTASQKNGTFRVVINSNTYDVPIKGFQNSTTASLISNTNIIPSSAYGRALGSGTYTQAVSATAYNPNSQYYEYNASTDDYVNVTSSANASNYTNYFVYVPDKPWDYVYANHLGWPDAPVPYSYLVDIMPGNGTTASHIGKSGNPYDYGYINNLIPPATTAGSTSGSTVGTSSHPYANGYFNKITIGNVTIDGTSGTGDSGKFLRGDGTWSNTLTGALNISNTNDGIKQGANGANGFSSSYTGTYVGDITASIYTTGGIYAAKNIIATRVFNAVFNDYAECRQTIMVAPGYVVIDQDNGTMIPSSERLQPGAQIVSDTYGHLMGMTEDAKTPIAVAGRVLAYTYRPREEYHAGMAVCSAPGGTVDIMTREEIKEYPDCIIGIVSEIPQYDTWGSDNIKVNGRIWIKVR